MCLVHIVTDLISLSTTSRLFQVSASVPTVLNTPLLAIRARESQVRLTTAATMQLPVPTGPAGYNAFDIPSSAKNDPRVGCWLSALGPTWLTRVQMADNGVMGTVETLAPNGNKRNQSQLRRERDTCIIGIPSEI
ncbi:hypothetical protein J6590_054729 [Homalodisca vitripennis]|nr:hypothetical protein J6590_054729 [Homalodisca vitripennis]